MTKPKAFRVALSGAFQTGDGEPVFAMFDLAPLTGDPDIEFSYVPGVDGRMTGESLDDFDALVLLLERFDAEATLAAVQGHRATSIYLVPTMMQRIWKLPADVRSSYDVSSLEIAYHLGEPCPRWLKRAWIDWLGPEVLWELYAGTESQARTVISGTEWLDHEGSVGRVVKGSITIRDSEGKVVPPGEWPLVSRVDTRSVPTEKAAPTWNRVAPSTGSSAPTMVFTPGLCFSTRSRSMM